MLATTKFAYLWVGISILLLCPTLQAQKSQFEKVNVSYMQLPLIKVPNDHQTYRGFISIGPSETHYNLIGQGYADRISIPGFTYQATDYDLEVNLKLGGFVVVETTPQTHKHERKKKDGSIETTYTFDYYVTYRLPASMAVRGYDGTQYMAREIASAKTEFATRTKSFNKSADRDTYWRNNRLNFLKDLEQGKITDYIQQTNSLLAANMGYVPKAYTAKIFYPENSRKTSHDYSSFQEALSLIKQGFAARNPTDTTSGNQQIREAIAIWQAELATVDYDNKKVRLDEKMAKKIMTTLATAYTFLYQFDPALDLLADAHSLKGMNSGEDRISKHCRDMEKRLELHPKWNGNRFVAARTGTNMIANQRPDSYTVAHNQRLEAQAAKIAQANVYQQARSERATPSGQGATLGIAKNSLLGETIGLVNTLIQTTNTNSASSAAAPVSPPTSSIPSTTTQAVASQPVATPAPASFVDYHAIKSAADPALGDLARAECVARAAQTWVLDQVHVYDAKGKAQVTSQAQFSDCVKSQRYVFDPNGGCEITPTCTQAATRSLNWMITGGNQLMVLIDADGATNYTLVRLSASEMVLETQIHTATQPLTRIHYKKAE